METTFYESIKNEAVTYGKSIGRVGQLRLIGIISRVLGLFLLIFNIVLCVFALFAFGAVAAIDALSQCMPVWAAALIASAVCLLLMAIVVAARKPLFVHPFIALMSKQLIDTEEHLEVETIKAEHEMELQTLRIGTKIENATHDVSFVVGLGMRIWQRLFGKKG